MPAHLLLVSLGPVQDFIAAARRCQDLWFGSFLLSNLSQAAASGIEQEGGSERLIFPGARTSDNGSAANKILAWLPANSPPADVAKRAKDAMHAKLTALRDEVFQKLSPEAIRYFARERAAAQIDDLMEFQWAAVPLVDEATGYAVAHAQVEQLLSWRKNTRTFSPVPWNDPQSTPGGYLPKSSIDGQRESVLSEAVFDLYKGQAGGAAKLYELFYIRPAERLCGIGLLKRIGEETDTNLLRGRPTFYSSSHVAAGPLRARVKARQARGEAAQTALATYLDRLRTLGLNVERYHLRRQNAQAPIEQRYDGVLFFASRLEEAFETDANDLAPRQAKTNAIAEARGALQVFLKGIELPEGEPVPYYAMLVADGDRMGNAIKELAKAADAEGLSAAANEHPPIDRHRWLSTVLADFAGSCAKIVQLHEGSLIYSGGDDVLALLPLHRVLACARALSDRFVATLKPLFLGLEHTPTLSVGIGIAHHLDLMDELRALTRDAERDAKKERDSLGVRLSPRSGGLLCACSKWSAGKPLDQRLSEFAIGFQTGLLPHSVAFDLEEAVRPLLVPVPGQGSDAVDHQALGKVGAALAKKVLGQKRLEGGAVALDPASPFVTEITDRIKAAKRPVDELMALSAELQIARLLARAHAQAEDNFSAASSMGGNR